MKPVDVEGNLLLVLMILCLAIFVWYVSDGLWVLFAELAELMRALAETTRTVTWMQGR